MSLFTFKKKKTITNNLYKDCSVLPIYNFDMVYKSKDYRYLVVEFDGYNDVEIPENHEEHWKTIHDQWIELIDNNEITYYYQLILEVTYLQTRYDVVKMLLFEVYRQDSMTESDLDLYIEALGKWHYNYDKTKDRFDEIERLMKQHKGSENKLGIKTSELKEMAKKDDGEVRTLEAQAVILEKITGIKVDIMKDSVIRWIEIQKLAQSINEQNRRK